MMYPTERPADGSTYYSLAGRIMGGGSSVNVMGVSRPTKHARTRLAPDHPGQRVRRPGCVPDQRYPVADYRTETQPAR